MHRQCVTPQLYADIPYLSIPYTHVIDIACGVDLLCKKPLSVHWRYSLSSCRIIVCGNRKRTGVWKATHVAKSRATAYGYRGAHLAGVGIPAGVRSDSRTVLWLSARNSGRVHTKWPLRATTQRFCTFLRGHSNAKLNRTANKPTCNQTVEFSCKQAASWGAEPESAIPFLMTKTLLLFKLEVLLSLRLWRLC